MPMTARRSSAPARRVAAASTSRAMADSALPTAVRSSRPSRSRAAMRSSSRCFHDFTASMSAPESKGARRSSAASCSMASGSRTQRSVSDRLAATTAMSASTSPSSAASRSSSPGWASTSRSMAVAAAACAFGQVQGPYRKRLLPNSSVFDEQRYFAASTDAPELFVIGGVRVGISICEDAWSPTGPIADQAAGGAELVVNINASPYYAGRLAQRERMLATRPADTSCVLVYVNQVGGQDE